MVPEAAHDLWQDIPKSHTRLLVIFEGGKMVA
jgi:hypothetical protein